MKYCERCKKEFDTEDEKCPICKGELVEVLSDEDAAIITVINTLFM